MRQRKLSLQSSFDFWGMTSHTLFNRPHIQSYFFVFERPVLDGMALDTFFQELGEYRDRGKVVVFCETMLTPFLVNHGHRFSSLVPMNFSIEYCSPPIKFPVTLFSKYRIPLLKAKTLTGESKEPLDEAMNIVRKENLDIASLLPSHPKKTTFANSIKFKNSFLYSKHLSLLSKSIAQIHEKYNNKERLKFIYFAISTSNVIKYISRYTYNDIFFEVLFIPNSQSNKKANIDNVMCKINSENDKLSYRFAQSNSIGEWEDVTSNADIIFYETAQDVSDFHYNPHYALCRSFLPILLFARGKASTLPLEKEFARPVYSYFWKVFFNNKEEYNNYLRYSIRKDNALLVLDGDVISTVINLINNYNTLNDLPCI